MDRELETKKLLCNNLYTLRKQNGATRRKVAIACGKNEESGGANAWGSNIELLANLTGQEDASEVLRRQKKCPLLTVQDLLNISELFHVSPVELLKGAESLYDLPSREDPDGYLGQILEKVNGLNKDGLRRLLDYLKDLLKIDDYRK